MKSAVAIAAIVAVAALSLLALWRALRAWGVIQGPARSLGPEYDLRRTMLDDDRLRHLRGLREVQFDYDTGKIDETDYTKLRQRHERAAAVAIRSLEALDTERAE